MKTGNDNSYTNFTQQMSPQTKKWYAMSIAGAVTSDGVVDDEELEYLKIAISFLDDPNDINEIVTMAKERKVPRLGQLRNVRRQDAFRILLALAKIVAADNVITNGEKNYITMACGKLGFSKIFAKKLFTWLDANIGLNLERERLKKQERQVAGELDKLLKIALNSAVEYR